ncbi:MAG: hypothetical protein FRX49_06928 [Trebouxia sp. A1-2]|nr:MAG: hypothetical protein FRX49_06928 [Trebouxia sp. A1-2]
MPLLSLLEDARQLISLYSAQHTSLMQPHWVLHLAQNPELGTLHPPGVIPSLKTHSSVHCYTLTKAGRYLRHAQRPRDGSRGKGGVPMLGQHPIRGTPAVWHAIGAAI